MIRFIERHKHILENTFSFGLLALALAGAFSFESRQEVKERDKKCVNCGLRNRWWLEAAHIDHTRDENYDNPSNGRTLCTRCHYIDHFFRRDNGLRRADNFSAVKTIWQRLRPEEKLDLPKPYEYYKFYTDKDAEVEQLVDQYTSPRFA